MTLSRQLMIVLFGIFFLIFTGTFYISAKNMRTYLNVQMGSHAKDAATSLGLSLTPYAAQDDVPFMNSMIDTIFDSGFYQDITLYRMNGTPLAVRHRELDLKVVPDWFLKLAPLRPPMAQTTLLNGWTQTAILKIRSHPGQAYIELWNNVRQTLWLFLAGFLGSILLIHFILRVVLRPLTAVENQALAISNREFSVLDMTPRTRELGRVVRAMNKMSIKVERMLREQTEFSEHVRKQAFIDDETGLPNRRSFEMHLNFLVSSRDEINYAAVGLLQLGTFHAIKKQEGYNRALELLQTVAVTIQNSCSNEDIVCRIADNEFAVILPNKDISTVETLIKAIVHHIESAVPPSKDKAPVHIGMSHFHVGTKKADVLAQADLALQSALSDERRPWCIQSDESTSPIGARIPKDWQSLLERALNEDQLQLLFQPVGELSGSGKIDHYEALARLSDTDGSTIPAAVLIPLAHRFNFSADFDREIFRKVLDVLRKSTEVPALSVNVTLDSILAPSFTDWLVDELANDTQTAHRLIIEIAERDAAFDQVSIKQIYDRLEPTGVRFCIDDFSGSIESFSCLRQIKFHSIKILGSHIQGIGKNLDNQFYVHSISDIAHGLDTRVIAKHVETDLDRRVLSELHIDGLQGYLLGAPGPLVVGSTE